MNTARNALLLPTTREVKYQAKTAIDTFFYRAGDLLSTLSIFVGLWLFGEGRLQFLWMIGILSVTMALVAWLVGREYSRRYSQADSSATGGAVASAGARTILAQ